MREAQIWYSRGHPDQRTLSSDVEHVIVLSDEFYQELIAHPVPNDLEAVKVLAASATALDLFMASALAASGIESPHARIFCVKGRDECDSDPSYS